MQTMQYARTTRPGVAAASAALCGLMLPVRALDRAVAGVRTTRGFALIMPFMLAMLLTSLSGASAQELRAAPPAEPDVLQAAPDPGAVAQESRDIAGRWLGASDAAVQEFGKAGGTLTNVVTGKVSGLSTAVSVADWASPVGALSAGDIRNAVSGAVAIKTGAAATAGAAALFGEIGAATGGVIGSFLPVIGNVAGTMVGGAIGTAAGGFIVAYGYDKYVKDYVIKRVTGLVSVFDTTPLDQAMQARRAFLLQTMSPEQQSQLQSFSPEEVQLIDFAALPYVPVLKQPQSNAPATADQQQAVLPAGNVLAGVRKIELFGQINCDIAGNRVTCRDEQKDDAYIVRTFSGTISSDRIDGTIVWDMTAGIRSSCQTRGRGTQRLTYTFSADGAVKADAGPISWGPGSSTCPGYRPSSSTTPGSSFVGKWRVLE
jgi:hypothetical protein